MTTAFNLVVRYQAPPVPDWRKYCWSCYDDLTNDYDMPVGHGRSPMEAIQDYLEMAELHFDVAPGLSAPEDARGV